MVDGVGHIGQRHTGALAGHPLGQHRGRRRDPRRGLARDHQGAHHRLRYGGNGLGIGGLLDHHMGIGATDPERGHPGPARPPHRRPLHGLRRDGEPRRPRTGVRSQLIEVQMLGNVPVAHTEHGLDETRRYRKPTPGDPGSSSPNPTPTAPRHLARQKPGSTPRVRSDHPTRCRCRGLRRSRYRTAANRDAANA